ncbi:MAG: hypothetical protein QOG67_922 [Verrucomicrobiota bacterium]|jgi:hypothetical protein
MINATYRSTGTYRRRGGEGLRCAQNEPAILGSVLLELGVMYYSATR